MKLWVTPEIKEMKGISSLIHSYLVVRRRAYLWITSEISAPITVAIV